MIRKKVRQVNEKAIEDFMIHDGARITNPKTLRNHRAHLRMFLNEETGIGKDYNGITQRDVDLYFGDARIKATTREVIKPIVRKFFEFHHIEQIDIQTNGMVLAKPTKGDEAVLTPDEIDKLIEAPREMSRKALIETFVVTGARKKEIRMLNLGDVKIESNIVWINVRESKTKARRIPVVPIPNNPVARYPKHLIDFVNSRAGEDPDTPLFYSHSFKSKYQGERISGAGIYDIFYAVKEKAGITRKVTPHIIRHTGASYDGVSLAEQMLCQKYGWVLGSNMARKYCHFNENQLAEQLLKKAGVKPEEQGEGRECPRCKERNNLFAKTCIKCHQVLDPKKLIEVAQLEEERLRVLERQFIDEHTVVERQDDRIKELENKVGILVKMISKISKDKEEKIDWEA